MKKILVALISLLLLFTVSAYLFIPGKLAISSSSSFEANREGVFRFLMNENNWGKWWPGTISKSEKGLYSFRYNDYTFQIDKILYNIIQLKYSDKSSEKGCLLKVIPNRTDSIWVELSTETVTGSDPFSRISGYLMAMKTKKILDSIVSAVQNYTGILKNIYGIDIKKEKVQYQDLVSLKKSFSNYPTTEDVYNMVEKLREFINRSGATELFSPMLDIKMTDSKTYIAQVGLPVNKKLAEEGDISLKWMMKDGNILTTDVTGGPKKIEEAMKQLEIYIKDYQRSTIAIPFQMLITDRMKESDTTKWVTRIYYPVV